MASVRRFLESRLKLKVNEDKSRVVKARDLEFLGFAFGTGGKIVWSAKSLDAFKMRVRQLTGRSWGVSMECRLGKLAQYLRGWMGYHAISRTFEEALTDHWIRRRIRCCYWKQWKTIRNRVHNLMRSGGLSNAEVIRELKLELEHRVEVECVWCVWISASAYPSCIDRLVRPYFHFYFRREGWR